MEPVTHVLTGACLARAGLNRKAAYATAAMAVAAELPDIDTLWSVRGPVESFAHHRGITHTFIGFPVEAAAVVGVTWLVHRWRTRRGKTTAAPVRWGVLYAFVLLALCSHIFLDWTNNYGIRPFFPFNKHWTAGSFVFIFDPYIFLALLIAVVGPPLFRLVSAEVGARREPFVSRSWSWFALVLLAAMWSSRAAIHHRAVQLAMSQSYELQASSTAAGDTATPSSAPPQILPAQRTLVSPDPLSFFRWYAVTDYGPLYQLSTLDIYTGLSEPAQFSVAKLPATPQWLAAQRSRIGQAYLDWSAMPLVRIDRDQSGVTGETVVTLQDGRFMGDSLLLSMAGRSPLTATVTLDRNNRVVEQTMDGKIEK